MALLGRDLIISANGVPVAAAKLCTVNVQSETIETSSPNDGKFKNFIAGRKSWSISTNHLVVESTLEDIGFKAVSHYTRQGGGIYSYVSLTHDKDTYYTGPQQASCYYGDGSFQVSDGEGVNVAAVYADSGSILRLGSNKTPFYNFGLYGTDTEHKYATNLVNYIKNNASTKCLIIQTCGKFLMTDEVIATIKEYLKVDLTGIVSTTEENKVALVVVGCSSWDEGFLSVSSGLTDPEEASVSLGFYQGSPVQSQSVKNMLLRVGNTYTMQFAVDGYINDRVSGTAICTSCKITGNVSNLANGQFEWKGSGPLA